MFAFLYLFNIELPPCDTHRAIFQDPLLREDERMFINFMRMSPDVFNEILVRVGTRITKQRIFYRDPIDTGLKQAITL